MSMAVGGGKGGPNHDINMTPMIDILLVLLIIFMVITPLVPKGLDVLVPQPNPNKPDKPQPEDVRTVVVSVDAQHRMKINQDAVTADELGPRLLEIFKTRAERVIFVKGDPDVYFGDVAGVIDIAKGALIDKVGLITENLEEGK
jgi:biopolymer transport protein TolR